MSGFKKILYTIAYKLLLFGWFVFRPTRIGARCMVFCEWEILLIKQSYMWQWRLPWWSAHRWENTLQTTIRELREELQLSVGEKIMHLHGLYTSTREYKFDQIAVFTTTITPKERNAIQADKKEVINMQWFDVDNLPEDIAPAAKRRILEWKTDQKQQYFTTW